MKPSSKRKYLRLRDFSADMGFLLFHLPRIIAAFRSGRVSPSFRERLMLAVTAVNRCRVCAYLHTKSALTSGVGEAEIRALLDGDVKNCPAEELPGMLYAQHWAETEGDPDAEARRRLIESCGEARAADIDILLRVIKTGNYWHNTLEALVHAVSFGRWGVGECDR